MSAVQPQEHHSVFPFPHQRIVGWVFLVGSIPLLVWVALAGVIAVPYPSFLSLYGGAAIACLFVGIGLLVNSFRLLSVALAILSLGILGWFGLP